MAWGRCEVTDEAARSLVGVLFVATLRRAHGQQAAKGHRIAIAHPSYPVCEMNETSGHLPWFTAFFAELRRLEDTPPLAKIQLGPPAAIGTDICNMGFHTISPSIGIISTPVIDPASGMLYVVARIKT